LNSPGQKEEEKATGDVAWRYQQENGDPSPGKGKKGRPSTSKRKKCSENLEISTFAQPKRRGT